MVVNTRGVIGANRHIVAEEMPFAEGQAVEIAVWARDAASAPPSLDRFAELRELARYLKEKYPDTPLLTNEQIGRATIYEDDPL